MKIVVVGMGYVGLANAVLLSKKHDVFVLDINKEKVGLINQKKSPIKDPDIENYLTTKQLSIQATELPQEAYSNADYIIIATPTNYDPETNSFNTQSILSVIKDIILYNSSALIVIKSTIPIGYTRLLRKLFHTDRIVFSPEFLREGKALHDNLHPSRIIIGEKSKRAKKFVSMWLQEIENKEVPVVYTHLEEAECCKLFSNTYLAMRVAFFNELDSFTTANGLKTADVIQSVCLDPRIGNQYNNPSFGYGGYCLPKDTKQLLHHYKNIPQSLIQAVVDSNQIRKEFIVRQIVAKKPKSVGFFRLIAKTDSDNLRCSSSKDILALVSKKGIKCLLYEPLLCKGTLNSNFEQLDNLEQFKEQSEIIVTNRWSNDLLDVKQKVFTQDIFSRD